MVGISGEIVVFCPSVGPISHNPAMVFSSSTFLFAFLPLALAGYALARSIRLRNLWLLLASLVFYAWGESFYVLILLASIFCNWLVALALQKHRRLLVLAAGVGLNLMLLGFYKYANFIVDSASAVSEWAGLPELVAAPVHLPLGISFFTFQAISYLVDVYREDAPAQRRLSDVALYIALFPQLIAGPIVRYASIQKQLAKRSFDLENFVAGARRFIIGLAKKVLIANVLGETADNIFGLESPAAATAWLGVACYTLQIYFDFSGYSDMAIGLGRMFGFRFDENFRYPYIATSIRDFWRRWHISLSSWFRDYVYIPLGGSRGGAARTALNLMIVFVLCGLWHGASWSFVVWGLFHGLFLSMERFAGTAIASPLSRIAAHVYVLLVVMIGWVFFRAETLGDAIEYLGAMVGLLPALGFEAAPQSHLNARVVLTLVIGAVLSTPIGIGIGRSLQTPDFKHAALCIGRDTVLVCLFVLSMMSIAAGTYNPFIYFRF